LARWRTQVGAMKKLSQDPRRVAKARALIAQLVGPVRLERDSEGLIAHVELEKERLALMASRRVRSMVAGARFVR